MPILLRLSRLVLIAACVFGPRGALSQAIDRPPAPRGADPNDWEAYYNAGVELLDRDSRAAEANFVWASRLRPDRAEPYYGSWIAFWARDFDRFPDYLRDDDKVLRDPRVRHADSLRMIAFHRSPFVHEGLELFLFNKLPGNFYDDQITRAWIALGRAELPLALDLFGKSIQREPKKYGSLHFVRASAFVNTRHNDSAIVELRTLLAQLRDQDEKSVGSSYRSKELLEYAVGLLQMQTRNTAAAREAFGRSIVENAAFVPAHNMLGQLALTAKDTTTALAEYALAMEAEPADVEARIGHGKALILAHHPGAAATDFLKAANLEPYYAEPFYQLAVALEAAGNKPSAGDFYSKFYARAAQSDARRLEAQRKWQELTSGPPLR
jgi:tetratricopeptide (TPR) repeat protein